MQLPTIQAAHCSFVLIVQDWIPYFFTSHVFSAFFFFWIISCDASLRVPLSDWGQGRGELEEDATDQENAWKRDNAQSPFFPTAGV